MTFSPRPRLASIAGPLFATVLALTLLASVTAAGEATKGTAATAPVAVGAKIATKKATPIADLVKTPDKYVGKVVRIEGKVKDVCQGMGCWVEVEDAKGVTFLAKSLDESVRLPKDCKGRPIVVEGVFTKLTPKQQQTEEVLLPGEAPHVCPKPTYLVATQGAALL